MKTALLALLVLSLTACQAFPPTPRSDDDRESAADGESDSQAPVISGLDETDREREQQRRRQDWTSPPTPAPTPARGELGEKALTGLTTNQTWDLLGPPTQVQEESPATVWTYEIAGCRLELFFYFDLESQEQRTLALDLEAASDFVGSRPFCWYTLAKRGRGRETPLPQAETAGEDRDNARVPTVDELDGEGSPDEDATSGADSAATQQPDDAAADREGTDADAPAQQDAEPASGNAQAQQDAPAQEESAQ